MNSTVWMRVPIWIGIVATLVTANAQGRRPAQYSVTDLGTLGGTYSISYAINNAGAVAGGAATPNQVDGIAQTAFVWYRGSIASLGTLGGSECPLCNSENAATNMSGVSVVLSETSIPDASGEDFCGFGTHRQCLAGIWQNGALHPLPTLPGGNNSQGYFINKQGQAVGFSETETADSNCAMPYQIFQFEGVKWAIPCPLRLASMTWDSQ
jgi:probable HAF family extracellular repeat protein